SLRGFDPELDYLTLTRESFGRRADVFAPSESLALRKATLWVPHQGGRRFDRNDPAYRMLHDWIAQGCRPSPSGAAPAGVEVLPARRDLHSSSPRQQLIVRARFGDGSIREVTDLAVFSSSNESDAPVTPRGLV